VAKVGTCNPDHTLSLKIKRLQCVIEKNNNKMRIKLATTCNKNEQQQDAKNNAELWTKWTNKTG
jgi:rhamnose utilization protein RhaD (predicted bifunctional aldolase and dehydrogenase)